MANIGEGVGLIRFFGALLFECSLAAGLGIHLSPWDAEGTMWYVFFLCFLAIVLFSFAFFHFAAITAIADESK